ncbi:hypothetical protein E8E14_006010 [Neopestalotiopsis sp. 37M]|nr:hypothetical protein E8E14_006010 [Neopestalotiopsis sp. 37M]
MPAATEQSNDPNDTGQNTSTNTNAGAAGAAGAEGRGNRWNCNEAVDKKLFDKKVTGLSDWLVDDEMDDFRRTIRCIIRTEYDAIFDSWPNRVMHNYVTDALKAIEQAINGRCESVDFGTPENEKIKIKKLLIWASCGSEVCQTAMCDVKE